MSFFLILSFKTADACLFKINPELQQAIGMRIYFCKFREGASVGEVHEKTYTPTVSIPIMMKYRSTDIG